MDEGSVLFVLRIHVPISMESSRFLKELTMRPGIMRRLCIDHESRLPHVLNAFMRCTVHSSHAEGGCDLIDSRNLD